MPYRRKALLDQARKSNPMYEHERPATALMPYDRYSLYIQEPMLPCVTSDGSFHDGNSCEPNRETAMISPSSSTASYDTYYYSDTSLSGVSSYTEPDPSWLGYFSSRVWSSSEGDVKEQSTSRDKACSVTNSNTTLLNTKNYRVPKILSTNPLIGEIPLVATNPKPSPSRRTSAISRTSSPSKKQPHSVVERRYRYNLNSKIEELHLALQDATGQEENASIRKQNVLANAVEYVHQTQLDLRNILDIVCRLNDKIRALEKNVRCEPLRNYADVAMDGSA